MSNMPTNIHNTNILYPFNFKGYPTSFNLLDSSLFKTLSTEQFRHTNWNEIPDELLMYIFLHDEPTYGKKRVQGTKKEYLRDLQGFLLYSASLGGIKHLDPADLLVYQDRLSEHYANTTFRKKVSVLKQFLRYIHLKKIIPSDLSIMMKNVAQPKDEQKNRDMYQHEVDALLEYFRPRNFNMFTLLSVLVSTGMRIEELASAEWRKAYYLPTVGFHFIDVKGKGGKVRPILIFEDTFDTIKEFRERKGLETELNPADESAFFPKPNGRHYNSAYLSNLFIKEINKSALPFLKYRADPITPHTCRHYYASFLTSAGSTIDAVKDALGHQSIITTQGYLWRYRQQEKHAAIVVGKRFSK
ncbi:tyrosine-type recombinase/integrase [Paenibacillus tepidiphilus]|uniref:tyrosine-type recombinase/integrase n=1 Tax=Paenibacillus tepidiphilus TaxID=2608683 RepID=UPI0013A561AF|nr:tyrosine-type recombinase/integrase [Paenibacillus tepidiphilus]